MRRLFCVLLTLALAIGLLASEARGAPPLQVRLDSLQTGYGRARAARRNGDLPTYLSALEHVARVVPDAPRLTYRLAGAYALLGHRDQARDLLDRVTRQGVGLDALEDPDFASLWDDPRFDALAARIRAARLPSGSSRVAFRLPERDLFPEGIAHDPVSGAFFLSSLYKRKIVRIDSTGTAQDFVAEGQDSLWCGLGMKVEPARRRLWVATSIEPFMRGFVPENEGQAALLCYDVDSGRLRSRSVLRHPPEPHLLNDLAVSRDGTVYVTDTIQGTVYRFSEGTEVGLSSAPASLEPLLEPGSLPNANGITLDAEERCLYVAHAFGVARVDLDSMCSVEVPCPEAVTATGIDGLYYHDGRLIALQTSLERVARFDLDPSGTRILDCVVLEGHHPEFREITTGVVVGRALYYIATCQYGSYGPDGSVPSLEELSEILVLWTPIGS